VTEKLPQIDINVDGIEAAVDGEFLEILQVCAEDSEGQLLLQTHTAHLLLRSLAAVQSSSDIEFAVDYQRLREAIESYDGYEANLNTKQLEWGDTPRMFRLSMESRAACALAIEAAEHDSRQRSQPRDLLLGVLLAASERSSSNRVLSVLGPLAKEDLLRTIKSVSPTMKLFAETWPDDSNESGSLTVFFPGPEV
jgi:hypothetical protein